MSSTIHVAVAVIEIKGKILIAKRPQHLHKGGYWEFPGGKVEAGESVEFALKRECQEELSILPIKIEPLTIIEHQYTEKTVKLDVWRVTDYLGVPSSMENQPLLWCEKVRLKEFKFPEANIEIIELINS